MRPVNPHLAEIVSILDDPLAFSNNKEIVEGLSLLIESLFSEGYGKVKLELLEEDVRWCEIMNSLDKSFCPLRSWLYHHTRRGGKLVDVHEYGIESELFYVSQGVSPGRRRFPGKRAEAAI